MADLKTVVEAFKSRKQLSFTPSSKSRLTEDFLTVLQKEDYVKLVAAEGRIKVINISINEVELVERVVVKARDILQLAANVLPTIAGTIIISTHKGLLTHRQAEESNVGGRVIAIVY